MSEILLDMFLPASERVSVTVELIPAEVRCRLIARAAELWPSPVLQESIRTFINNLFPYSKTHPVPYCDIHLQKNKNSGIFAAGIGIWCNGSTTDFGSVCSGSNPDIPT